MDIITDKDVYHSDQRLGLVVVRHSRTLLLAPVVDHDMMVVALVDGEVG